MSEKHVSINIFDLIDSICADFRREWKAGKRPRIEDFLRKVPENARETLLRNLLPVDIRYRERGGEKPQSGDYLQRFPQHKRVIGDAFNFSTSIEMQAMQSTPADDSADVPATIEAPAASRIGEYELIRELGRGGFGVVYEAKHVTRRNRVALKTLPTGHNGQEVNAERLHKFRREFRSLSEVNHPNLVGMQSLEVDGDQWFFTMDLIAGEDFLTYVRPSGKLDESRLRSSLKQLAAGVIALHEQRILHRDLKPSNVLVDASGRVSILDFGLVAELEQRTDQTASMQTQHFAGTPRYAAPEQVFGQRSPATDWYAVGTMLFEALTGEAPYRGTAAELLIKKQNEDPPPLSDRDDLPSDLATLTDRLLRRAPEQRPASEELADALAVELRTVSHSSHASHDDEDSSRQSLADDASQLLIGREEQLAQLEEAKQAFMRNRQPDVVWISGLSGEGKSSLAEKFLAPLRRSGEFLVLSGRCYDRESVPFKAVDVMIEALVSFLRSRSQDQVNAWLPRDIQMLARLFPTLRRVAPIEDQSQGELANIDDRQIRYRAFFALREMLVSISRETPLVLFIDDLQWGDADSAEVLADLLSPPNPPVILLLASYRSDEAEQSPFLREWKRCSERQEADLSGRLVEVTPLTEEQCLEFMAQMVGIPAEKLREQAHDMLADTKGNPYFLEQLVEGFNAETGQFQPVPLRDIVERKLRQLPDDARDLLNAIAIAGQAVSVEEASLVAGHETSLFSTVTHMRSERLVRLIGSGEQQLVDTYHDKIRESVLDAMPDAQRRLLHSEFGTALEATAEIDPQRLEKLLESSDIEELLGNARFFDLAFHFDHAGNDSKACLYAFLAARQAKEQFSLEIAVEQFRRAHSHAAGADNRMRYQIALGLSECLLLLGRYDESKIMLSEAHDFADDLLDRCEAELCLAEVMKGNGQYAESASQYIRSLRSLDVVVPEHRGLAFGILKEGLVHLSHHWLRMPSVSANRGDRKALLRIRLLAGYIMAVWFRSLPSVVWCALAALNRAERIGPTRELTTSQMLVGMIHCAAGFESRGFRFFEKAKSQIREDDLGQQLLLAFYVAGSYLSRARFEECGKTAESGLQLIPRTGDVWRSLILRLMLVLKDYRLGCLDRALERALDEFETSVRLGDANTSHDEINCVAMISGGRFNFPAMKARLTPIPDNYQATNQLLIAESKWHLHHGRTKEALELAQKALALIEENKLINFITGPTFPLVLACIREHALRIKQENPDEAKRLIRRGCQLSRKLTWLAATVPADYPPTLRERANLLAVAGKRRKAERLYKKSCALAEKQGARYEHALSLLALKELLFGHGQDATADELEQARHLVHQFEVKRQALCDKHPLLKSG